MTGAALPRPRPDAERDALAGEYALGLLDDGERLALEARLLRDPDLAARVASWQRHLVEIDLTSPPVTPPPELWTAIEAAIHRGTIPQPIRSVAAAPSLGQRLWSSLALWRWSALAAMAAALVLGIGLVGSAQRLAIQPVLVAVLMTADNEAAAIVNVAADGRAELKPLKAFEVPAGKAIEIWTLWDRQVGPRSIGLIGQTRGVRLDLSKLPRQPGQLFEMTLEPATGSPTGRPTGPILTKGNATTPL